MLEGVLQGRNGTVFCYGATGTGKTYTMLGTLENPGLMMLAIKDLFSKVGRSGRHGNHRIQLSCLEVHNEVVKDLLSPGRRLLLRQDGQEIVAAGLTHHTTHSAEEAVKLLQQGNGNRTAEQTRVNDRSHAILQAIVEYRSMYEDRIVQVGKLSLIDFVGSESALFALKTCINGPVEGKKSRPYPNTKLAQLLKNSIDGSHNIVMIANISPSNISFSETQNTLHWADRAKSIKTKACSAATAKEEAVKQQLVLELQGDDSGLIEAFTGVQVPDSKSDVAKLALLKDNTVLAAENAELRRKVEVLEAEIEKLKEHLVELKQKAEVDAIHKGTHILALSDDAIAEILLRLPQNSPSCLPRASLVCKSWLRIVSNLGFLRHLRALNPTPHVRGFFQRFSNLEFVPTTASAFSFPAAVPRSRSHSDDILDCRHGRALIFSLSRDLLVVWSLLTGEQRPVPLPTTFPSYANVPLTTAVVCATDDCDHRGCHCHGRHFFLVLASAPETYNEERTMVWVYSSEADAWGAEYLVGMTHYFGHRPSTLVGRTVYLSFQAFRSGYFLEYDLVRHDLALLEIPEDLLGLCHGNIIIIPVEDGRLGLASLEDNSLSLSLWSRDDHARWTPHMVVDLDLDVPATCEYVKIIGFAEGVDVIFVDIDGIIFSIELKSGQVRRLCEDQNSGDMIFPLVST